MTRFSATALRTYAGFALARSQRWRFDVVALRKLIDAERATDPRLRRITDVLAARLLRAMTRHSAALVPSIRELRRIDRRDEALAVAEHMWESRGQTSAEWALACAISFYDNKTLWLGDIALAHAMTLEPAWIELHKEQARNRRWRGNTALAIEGAERVLDLSQDPSEQRQWHEFIGFELRKARRFTEALRHLEAGEPDDPDWQYWYCRAVCCQRIGDLAAAGTCYRTAGPIGFADVPPALRTAAMHLFEGALHDVLAEVQPLTLTKREDEIVRLTLLGRALLRLELPGQAARQLEASELRNASDDISAIIALAHELDGRSALACQDYREMLSQHPNTQHPVGQRLARALSAEGESEQSVREWMRTGPDLVGLASEADPHFADNVERASQFIATGSWADALPLLRRAAASASSPENVRKLHHAAGHATAATGDLPRAERHFTLGSLAKVPHPGEADLTFSPLGPYERYAEARESLALDPGLVVFEAFRGAKTAGNPLALSRRLLRDRPDLHQVWAISRDTKVHESLLGRLNVSFVEVDTHGYRQHLATAQTVINNSTFQRYFSTRAGQRYLNTWHGVPWKSMGRDISDDPFAYDNVARNFLQATHMALPDDHTRHVLIDRHDVAALCTARIDITGQPRMDRTLTMDPQEASVLRRRLGVAPRHTVVLYAPTWRGKLAAQDSSVEPYLQAISTLSSIEGAHVLVRVHYYVTARLDPEALPTNVTVVPEDIDSNEVLAITDVLVSDFSSIIFDFAALNRPIVKHLADLDRYTTERGLYFPVSDMPGVTTTDHVELREAVTAAVRGDVVCDWSTSPVASAWQHEDGHATERTLAFLFDDRPCARGSVGGESLDHRPAPMLISMGSLNPNGMSRSLRNLVDADPTIGERAQFVIPRGALENRSIWDVARDLHTKIDFRIISIAAAATRRENMTWRRLKASDAALSENSVTLLRSRMRRERVRNFGRRTFSAVVDFDGYGYDQAVLFGFGFHDETLTMFVLHNEMVSEIRAKYPYLRSVARILPHFDVLASVIGAVKDVNQEALADEYGVPESLHTVLPNTINLSQIRELAQQDPDSDVLAWFRRPGPHVVLVGRLSVEKNHAALFEALARLLTREGTAPRLTLLGDGPSRPELQRRAHALGLDDYVMFAGHRANPYPVMKHADALFLPSRHEGQPLVLLEAMTLRTPVVATTIPGPTELLREGALGLLVSPEIDGLEEALIAVMRSDLPPADAFDPDEYQRNAITAFWALVDGPGALPRGT